MHFNVLERERKRERVSNCSLNVLERGGGGGERDNMSIHNKLQKVD